MSTAGTSHFTTIKTRHPSDGSISQEGMDLENHFIIRFPPEIAPKVRQFVEQDAHSNADRLSLNFDGNLRTGSMQFDQNTMHFTVYDLPCISEVMKTLDNKTVYKVADLTQMIVADLPGIRREMKNWGDDLDSRENQQSEPGYLWPHGLCPPMRDARRKRFRKTKKKKYMDAPDVERELKRLLRSDLDALSVRWEVVTAAEIEETEKKQTASEPTDEPVGILEEPYEYGMSLSESDEDGQNNL